MSGSQYNHDPILYLLYHLLYERSILRVWKVGHCVFCLKLCAFILLDENNNDDDNNGNDYEYVYTKFTVTSVY